MKFSIKHNHIQEILSKFGKILNERVSLPILSGVLVQATEKQIVFTASDATDSMVIRFPVKEDDGVLVEESGSVVIPKKAFEISKKLKGIIKFDLDDTAKQIKMSQNKTEINHAVMDASEYPSIGKMDANTRKFDMPGTEFAEIIRKTAFAASDSNTRPILQSVLMSFSNSGNKFVATDSHRLASYTHATIDHNDVISLPVPAKALVHLSKTFDFTKKVFIITSNNQVAFGNDNTLMYTRLLEGNYPATDRLIPIQYEAQLTINRQELLEALELLQVLTNNSVVKLTLGTMFATLDAHNEVSAGNREIAYENYQGPENFTIGFSAEYVIDALKAFDSPSVNLAFGGSQKPFIVTEITNNPSTKSALQLVLPVRTY
ncbi:DNA polymerase III subunit beta [Rummeliibacillus stabekisii]|uniref:DNA polymerase III subunit beta n=1 Tax=Rummeliibacillus stabekisii TaxID=241244 RepID=UPI00203C8FAD|nr:DNA polymerase III subunit beta [Rummeliibacillus stabekisii]MCM3317946.1 DNA polymerase III subunit beta [Rummeliibacillus stabekisii]